MICSICNGLVLWDTNLRSTTCQNCGSKNTQMVEQEESGDDEDDDQTI